ncbi:acyl-CoA dehydrogenase family protein [Amycolatopsis sp. NPDC004079]|uniref:acyl-CoA dehydrogenase family protein n=1 Tax=Amycolatopsis sp. NPDC004079 TaxID=3154549 RepID=UPI0033BB61C8
MIQARRFLFRDGFHPGEGTKSGGVNCAVALAVCKAGGRVKNSISLALDDRQKSFLAELCDFFGDSENLELLARADADPRELYRRMGDLRLLAPDWPERYGGRGYGQVEVCLLLEAMGLAGCPDTLYVTSVQVAGNVVLHHGSDALKEEFLPGAAAGERFASVLFSEFATGSDLAAISTHGAAFARGDWLVSGTKAWSARTPFATDLLCAFRTGDEGSRYEGLSLALVPAADPGVQITALSTLGDEAFHEIRLDDVPVCADRLVGPPGGAWPVLSGSISFERTGFDYLTRAARWLNLCADSAEARCLEERYQAARFFAYRTAERVDRNGRDDGEAALVKLLCSELAQDCAYLFANQTGSLDSAVREAPGLTISAGASEVLIDLVASALPDSALSEVR